ncbi:MFS transporter [Sphingomonas sp. HHU CXW]|uniref:MFS transporter n=1 Tax=Sphingomonas hominis TaxID=2741495 RepID=A0ABX2JK89_9SPHN|nr:MFS transporter [Sphingomonas hominis]
MTLLLLNMAATTDRMVFGALAPVLSEALRLSDRQLALVTGPAFGVAYAAALPFAGWLVDRIGARRMLVGSVLVWTLGMVVSALAGMGPGVGARALPFLLLGRGITGVGQAALTPAAFALILGNAAPAHVGRGLTLFTGAGTMGRGIAFLAAGVLLGAFNGLGGVPPWSATLLTLAAGNVVFVLVGTRFVRGGVPGQPVAWSILVRWLRTAPLSVVAAVTSALGTVVIAQALSAWIAVVLVRAHMTSPAKAALLIGVVGTIASPLGHVAGGALTDSGRLGKGGIVAATLVCAPLIWAFVVAPTLPIALVTLGLVLVAAGIAGAIGLVRVQRLIPAEVRGTANGVFMTLVALLGISGGPLLVPLLSADVGLGLAATVLLAALIAAVAGLLADRGTAVVAR